jgi:hypothetical protein
MKSVFLTLLLFIAAAFTAKAQNVGVQFYQGVNKPLVSFSADASSLNYTSSFNSDTRIGVYVGDLKKLSFSTLLGASTTNAVAVNDDITASFSHSSLRIDVPIRYSFSESSPISSIAIGPSIGVLMSSTQSVNGLPIRTEELFTATNFYVGGEVDFFGYSKDKLSLHPYISYRLMLNNADLDDDNLKINELSFGIRVDISK